MDLITVSEGGFDTSRFIDSFHQEEKGFVAPGVQRKQRWLGCTSYQPEGEWKETILTSTTFGFGISNNSIQTPACPHLDSPTSNEMTVRDSYTVPIPLPALDPHHRHNPSFDCEKGRDGHFLDTDRGVLLMTDRELPIQEEDDSVLCDYRPAVGRILG